MPTSAPSPAPPKRSKRIYILWGAALTLLLTAALFCWLVVVPVWRTGVIVGKAEFCDGCGNGPTPEKTIEELGGRDRAFGRLSLYLRMPELFLAHKPCATFLLGCCGTQAIPMLERLQHNKDVGHIAKQALAKIKTRRRRSSQPLPPAMAGRYTGAGGVSDNTKREVK